jgi:hypothetical protein
MDVSSVAASELFEKSILIEGTLGTLPFTFYHTLDEDFETDYEDAGQNLVVTAGQAVTLVFDFNLSTVLNNVDLSTAVDGNNDGLIEISPNDPDGNNAIADAIKAEISRLAELSDD